MLLFRLALLAMLMALTGCVAVGYRDPHLALDLSVPTYVERVHTPRPMMGSPPHLPGPFVVPWCGGWQPYPVTDQYGRVIGYACP